IKMDKKWMERFFASGEVQTKWRDFFIHRANSQQNGVNLQRVERILRWVARIYSASLDSPAKCREFPKTRIFYKKTLLTNSVNKASPQLLINMRRILRRR